MMHGVFSSEITEEEAKLGFEIITVPSEYELDGPVEIAARKLSDSDYLFKAADGEGYKHVRYGYQQLKKSETPDWHPIGEIVYDSPYIDVGEVIIEKKDNPFNVVPVPFKEGNQDEPPSE